MLLPWVFSTQWLVQAIALHWFLPSIREPAAFLGAMQTTPRPALHHAPPPEVILPPPSATPMVLQVTQQLSLPSLAQAQGCAGARHHPAFVPHLSVCPVLRTHSTSGSTVQVPPPLPGTLQQGDITHPLLPGGINGLHSLWVISTSKVD